MENINTNAKMERVKKMITNAILGFYICFFNIFRSSKRVSVNIISLELKEMC